MRMSKFTNKYRFLFAGGGTGGHLFPAIAVANELKKLNPHSEILFVGSKFKIEGRVLTKLGYKLKHISVRGFDRKISVRLLLFPFYLIISLLQSLLIVIKFNPKVSVGTGGYISGPAIWASSILGTKIILIEPNSYPGITTRLLEKYADEIHISYEYSKKFLRRQNILKLTGNPTRFDFNKLDKKLSLSQFGLSETKRTLLVLGGSLGAKSINIAIENCLDDIINNQIQIIWQVGKNYLEYYKKFNSKECLVFDFIENINEAFSASDLVIARAGASTISEIALLGLPAILVPSPNVAENHQYHNAKALVENNAALLVNDEKLNEDLFSTIKRLIFDDNQLNILSTNIKKFSKPDASYLIAKSALKLAEEFC